MFSPYFAYHPSFLNRYCFSFLVHEECLFGSWISRSELDRLRPSPPKVHTFIRLDLSVNCCVVDYRDILPVMSTLRHNEFFEGIIDKSGRMAPEFIEELSFVLNSSQCLKKLELTDCAFKP